MNIVLSFMFLIIVGMLVIVIRVNNRLRENLAEFSTQDRGTFLSADEVYGKLFLQQANERRFEDMRCGLEKRSFNSIITGSSRAEYSFNDLYPTGMRKR